MQLVYSNPEQTTIIVTLAEGEALGDLVGPIVAHIPADAGNRHYADIQQQDLAIAPYAGAPVPAPAPLPAGAGGGTIPTPPLNQSGSA